MNQESLVKQLKQELIDVIGERDRLLEESQKLHFTIAEAVRMEGEQMDLENARWQRRIEGIIAEYVNGIDGSGCDSGDPLDLTATELELAFGKMKEELINMDEEMCLADQSMKDELTANNELRADLESKLEILASIRVSFQALEYAGCTCYSDPDGDCDYCGEQSKIKDLLEKALGPEQGFERCAKCGHLLTEVGPMDGGLCSTCFQKPQ